MSILSELKRRNVLRVLTAYVVASWLIIQVAETIFPLFGFDEGTVRLVVIILAIGIIPVAAVAWSFELTPDGLKKESSEVIPSSARGGTRLDRAIVVILALAVAYFVFDKFVLTDAGRVPAATDSNQGTLEKTVAVLPFEALSSGEDDGYFADGLTDEILVALDQLPELQVSARMSAFAFKGQAPALSEVAERLNVNYVVQGSIRRSGNDLRISVQLARTGDGINIWSQNYDPTLDNVFSVQQEIAERVAESLGVALDDTARQVMRNAGIGDVGAFIDYQKGLEAFTNAHQAMASTSELLAVANVHFDRALEIAPDLSMARIVRADANAHLLYEMAAGFRNESNPGEAQAILVQLREEYDAAWRLTPAGNQRDILNVERTLYSEDWSSLPFLIQNAMQPGECPRMNWSAEFLSPFGWADAFITKYDETMACNPNDFGAGWHLPQLWLQAGNPTRALQSVEAQIERGNTHPWLEDARFWALLAAGRAEDPLAMAPKPPGSLLLFPREILRRASLDDQIVAKQLVQDYLAEPDADLWSTIILSAAIGDRQRANLAASAADSHPGGIVLLSLAVYVCFCGAPFDLDSTPNYKARVTEAGFPWPPEKIIDYPMKNW